MEFSRQEYWSGLPFPFPGDLPDPGVEPGSPALQVDSLPSEPPGNALNMYFSKDADSNPPPSNHPGSTGAGPWQLRDFTFTFPGGSDGKLSA